MRKLVPMFIAVTACLSACTVQRTPMRTVTAVIPATAVTTVAVTANVGIVKFTPSQDDRIHVSVDLVPEHYRFFGLITDNRGEDAARAAMVSQALANGNLALAIQYPANTDSSGISEHWNVQLPAALAVRTHVATGELDVNGLTGGVDATLDVGKVTLDVPGGPLKVNMNVGKVDATVHSLDYGEVTLSTNVGKSTLSVEGAVVGSGQKNVPSSSVSWNGSGKNPISMQVNVGKLDVALSKN